MNIETIEVDAAQWPRPRKANECIIDPKRFYFRRQLFDEFWRDGDLAMLFGAPGTGKSVLAVQIADALARGKPLDGFRMPTGRRKVLYVDLVLQDLQFQSRYSYLPPNTWYAKTYKFAENLHRDRPPSIDELVGWLGKTVREEGFQVVIIDDLSAVKRTHDGIRETLALMRELKRLRDELGVSILAIAASDEPGWKKMVSEHDLKRSRVLSGVADSVFAIGRTGNEGDDLRCIIQTRSRNSSILWKEHNAPTAQITRLENGMLGFRFDDRFAPRMDPETRRLICRIRSMREAGSTYRAIAEELGISKSQAARLYKRWTPAMDRGLRNADCGSKTGDPNNAAISEPNDPVADPRSAIPDPQLEEWEEADLAKPVWLEAEQPSDKPPEPFPQEPEIETPPKPRTIYDLKRGIDDYGREIYIENDYHDGRPGLWYYFDRQGKCVRNRRDGYGIFVNHLKEPPSLSVNEAIASP